MPQERESNYPMPTAAEVDAMPGDPATKAARNIMARHVTGIPARGFLTGQADDAPVFKGVRDLTEAVLRLHAALPEELPNEDTLFALTDVLAILGDNRCPAPVVDGGGDLDNLGTGAADYHESH